MIPKLLKSVIKKSLNELGFELQRAKSRSSIIEVLQQCKNLGLLPETVIDIGAAYGEFTLECCKVYPGSKYLLIEPLDENRSFLEAVTRSCKNSEFILAAAAAKSGEITLNVHPDLVGSSLFLENEDNVNGVPRIVPSITLDSLKKEGRIKEPFLIKIDAQGAELEILLGSEETLSGTEYIIIEVSFFEFFKGGPQLYDIVMFMKSRGFVAYDIFGLQYRPLDYALSQVDIVFVKEKGIFRKHHFYATQEQRKEQNRRFGVKI